MLFPITPEQQRKFLEARILAREGVRICPGIICPGKQPFGFSPSGGVHCSPECYQTCLGTNGLSTLMNLPLLCRNTGETITIARKDELGLLGSRTMASLTSM